MVTDRDISIRATAAGEPSENTLVHKPPDKETVRKWLNVRHRYPPDPEQIRKELGWSLSPAADRCKDD